MAARRMTNFKTYYTACRSSLDYDVVTSNTGIYLIDFYGRRVGVVGVGTTSITCRKITKYHFVVDMCQILISSQPPPPHFGTITLATFIILTLILH